jgi:hypothetical protein
MAAPLARTAQANAALMPIRFADVMVFPSACMELCYPLIPGIAPVSFSFRSECRDQRDIPVESCPHQAASAIQGMPVWPPHLQPSAFGGV